MTTIPTTITATSTVRGTSCFQERPCSSQLHPDRRQERRVLFVLGARGDIYSGANDHLHDCDNNVILRYDSDHHVFGAQVSDGDARGARLDLNAYIPLRLPGLQCYLDENPQYGFQLCGAISMSCLVNPGLVWFATLF